jgi:hypothetical protein
MTKEEILELIKENLTVTIENGDYDYDGQMIVKVNLFLGEENISEDCIYI